MSEKLLCKQCPRLEEMLDDWKSELILAHSRLFKRAVLSLPQRTFSLRPGNLHIEIANTRLKMYNYLVGNQTNPIMILCLNYVCHRCSILIFQVEQKRWKVDVNSYRLANLSLANVKLPTGELRRKSEDDERAMRSFMRVSYFVAFRDDHVFVRMS